MSPLEEPCAPGQNLRSSDLCAQWKAADAASEGATWTARTFWLSLLGTLFGAGTLVAAFMAARYAKHAAQEARRSADIAKDALIASERAWITVGLHADSPIAIERAGTCSLSVSLKVTNIGRTPALNAHTSMTMIPSKVDHRADVKAYADEHRVSNDTWSRTVLPGESYDRGWGLGLDEVEGVLYGVVIGCVTYETLPDRALHQTAFCYYVGGRDHAFLNRDIPKEEVTFTVATGGFAD